MEGARPSRRDASLRATTAQKDTRDHDGNINLKSD